MANRAGWGALDEAIKLCDNATTENLTAATSIRGVEELLGFPVGTFDSRVGVRGVEAAGQYAEISPRALLVLARDAVGENLARMTTERALPAVPAFIPPVIRICSAVIIGAAFGAPLAALSVHESLIKEMVKAGIQVFVGATGAVLVDDLLIKKMLAQYVGTPPSIRVGNSDDETPETDLTRRRGMSGPRF